MIAVAQTLIWGAVIAWGVWRVCETLALFAPVRGTTDGIPPLADVPEDLVAYAMQEREAWAQEEVLRAVQERYDELRDWNKVRSAVGIGRIDG